MRTLVVVGAEAPRQLLDRLASRGHEVVTRDAERALDGGVAGFDLVIVDAPADRARTIGTSLLAGAGRATVALLVGEPESRESLDALIAAGFAGYLPLREPNVDFALACAEKNAKDRAGIDALTSDLRVSEARYRSVIAAMHEGILLCAADGTVLTCNASAERILGVSLGSLLSWTPQSNGVVHVREDGTELGPEDLPARVALRTGVPVVNVVLGAKTAGHETVWLRMTAHPIRWDEGAERPQGVVVTFSDLTKRRALEAQLRISDRLASVGRLAATVGHEINNPLAYIIGNLDALASKGAAQGPEAARLIADARDGAERVRRIVRDLKVFARDEPEGVAPIDVRRVLDSAINIASNEIRHRARLVREYGDVRAVVANESRLGQVFLNLLVNAAQAIREGDVQGNEVRVTTRESGPSVVIEIRDSGVGIAPELLARVFEPYFTTKPGGAGTGLGLSICHSLLVSVGGSIVVESEVGKGSVFRVSLPATDEPARDESQPPSARSASTRQRILIVDDEPRLALTLKLLLRDHDVEIADGGRRALDRLAKGGTFDIILCDLMMVDVNGSDVYERVRKDSPGLEKRIIFMTGGAFAPRASAFLASVPNECLEKPFPIEELLRAMRRTLKNSSE